MGKSQVMIIEQLYTKCLSQGAYYIESNGEAAVIDPLRDVDAYIKLAAEHNARIVYVFETHFHADFVSGHIDLAAKTGATIVYGPTASPSFPAMVAKDNEVFTVGHLTITVLHTPGHTPESCCYLLKDNNGKQIAVFTGDTLFIGDVGRPDLAQASTGLSKEQLAGMLYDSIQNKLLPLPGDVIIYPGHGAGSACGKQMSANTTDTLEHQRRTNYALRDGISKEEFVKEVLSGLPSPAKYFSNDVMLNKGGYESFDEIVKRAMVAKDAEAFHSQLQNKNILVLDSRCPEEFCKGFVPGSVNIGLDGQFAPWAGTLFPDLRQPILIVADPGRELETITRLARVGHDNIIGYLAKGFDTWYFSGHPVEWVHCIHSKSLHTELENDCKVIDVREASSFNTLHIKDAISMPLAELPDRVKELNPDEKYYVYCTSGYRSVIAISLLKTKGFNRLVNVIGGMNAINQNTGIQLEAVQQTK